MFIIGITGGIGSGKSTVAGICNAYGIPVIDADKISMEVTGPDGPAIDEIIEVFGSSYIKEDGSLNREKMAELVFSNRTTLDKLSYIVHKYVIKEIIKRTDEFEKEKEKALVLDVPIPVKEGFLDLCNQVWLVWAEDDIRIERLKNRNMNEKEAVRRIASQMTREEYENLSDFVIENNGTFEELETLVNNKLDEELLQRGIRIK